MTMAMVSSIVGSMGECNVDSRRGHLAERRIEVQSEMRSGEQRLTS